MQISCNKKRPLLKALSILLVVLTLCSITLTASAAGDTFKVGMECGYSPFNWTQLDDSNEAVPISGTTEFANGYDVQIAKRIAQEMGKELVVVKISWDGLIPSLNSGQIDAIAAGMSATAQRKEVIDFSENYYYSDLVVVIKKDGSYASATKLDDFASAKLTGQLGTLHYDVIDQVKGVKKGAALKDFPNMIIALQAGTIDGYISERPGAISASTANPDLTFIDFPLGEGFIFDDAEVSIGVGIAKDNPLLGEVNAALSKIPQEEREEVMTTAIKTQPSGLDEEVTDTAEATSEVTGEPAITAVAGKSFFQKVGAIWGKYWPHFIKGAGTTLLIALIGTIIGLIIGLIVATFKLSPPHSSRGIRFVLHKIASVLISIYVEVFRGTPMMVQAMVFYYGMAYILKDGMSPLLAGIIILSINTGAYMAEVVRGGIESVDPGQLEAGMAIGMTHRQTMLGVVLPQAIRNILPATGNEFVINIKDTSVFNVIAVTELYYAASDVRANTLLIFESFLITAVIYLVLTFTVTRILRVIERKMDGPANYALTSSTTPATVALHQKQGGK